MGLPVLIIINLINHRFLTNQNVRTISVYLPGSGWVGAVIGWDVCVGDEVSVGVMAEKKKNKWANGLINQLQLGVKTVSKKVSAIYSFLIAYVNTIQLVSLLSD